METRKPCPKCNGTMKRGRLDYDKWLCRKCFYMEEVEEDSKGLLNL